MIWSPPTPYLNIHARIPQALNLHRHHSLSTLYSAEFPYDSFQWAMVDANAITGLEDVVSHFDFWVGLAEHDFQVLNLGVLDDCRSFLTRVGQEFVDEGMVGEFLNLIFICVDEDNHRNDYSIDLHPMVTPLVDFWLDWNIICNARAFSSLLLVFSLRI